MTSASHYMKRLYLANHCVSCLNNSNPAIKFTCNESNKEINFLDDKKRLSRTGKTHETKISTNKTNIRLRAEFEAIYFFSERFEIPVVQTPELQRKHPASCPAKNTRRAEQATALCSVIELLPQLRAHCSLSEAQNKKIYCNPSYRHKNKPHFELPADLLLKTSIQYNFQNSEHALFTSTKVFLMTPASNKTHLPGLILLILLICLFPRHSTGIHHPSYFPVINFFHKYFHKRAPLSSMLLFIPLTVIHTLLLLLSFCNPHTCLCTSSEQTDLIYPCPQEAGQKHETTQRFDFEGHYIKKWIPWPCCPKICSHQFLKQLNPSNIQELYDHTTGISAGWLGDNTALAESISIDLGLVVKVC